MAKLELQGVVKEVSPVSYIGANNTKKQSLILFIPGWVDRFGEKKGQDEEWPLDIIGDAVQKLNLLAPSAVGQKAICTVYMSGRSYIKDGKTSYFISANLGDIKFLGAAAPIQQSTPVQMPVATGDTVDDMPF